MILVDKGNLRHMFLVTGRAANSHLCQVEGTIECFAPKLNAHLYQSVLECTHEPRQEDALDLDNQERSGCCLMIGHIDQSLTLRCCPIESIVFAMPSASTKPSLACSDHVSGTLREHTASEKRLALKFSSESAEQDLARNVDKCLDVTLRNP